LAGQPGADCLLTSTSRQYPSNAASSCFAVSRWPLGRLATLVSDGPCRSDVACIFTRPTACPSTCGKRPRSPSPSAFLESPRSHLGRQGDAAKGAGRHDPIVAASPGNALKPSPHGQVAQPRPRETTSRLAKLRGIEVSQPHLDPARAGGPNRHAQAVSIANIDNLAGEEAATPILLGDRPAVGYCFAGVGQGGPCNDQGEKRQAQRGPSPSDTPRQGSCVKQDDVLPAVERGLLDSLGGS